MKKAFRVFEAPPAEIANLPIAQSPWHFERDAKIPLEHWELIIEFSRSVDSVQAELLEKFSVGSFDNDGYLDMTDSILDQIMEFMSELKSLLKSSEPITKYKGRIFNEFDNEFDNDEYGRMLEAVIAVYEEGKRLEEPVCAYND